MELQSVYSHLQWWKNGENWPRKARVIVENKVALFSRTRCIYGELFIYDRFGDKDVEIAAAGWDDSMSTGHPTLTASYQPLPPAVTVRPAATAAM